MSGTPVSLRVIRFWAQMVPQLLSSRLIQEFSAQYDVWLTRFHTRLRGEGKTGTEERIKRRAIRRGGRPDRTSNVFTPNAGLIASPRGG